MAPLRPAVRKDVERLAINITWSKTAAARLSLLLAAPLPLRSARGASPSAAKARGLADTIDYFYFNVEDAPIRILPKIAVSQLSLGSCLAAHTLRQSLCSSKPPVVWRDPRRSLPLGGTKCESCVVFESPSKCLIGGPPFWETPARILPTSGGVRFASSPASRTARGPRHGGDQGDAHRGSRVLPRPGCFFMS